MAESKIPYTHTVTGVTSGTDLNNLSYYIDGNTREYIINKLSDVTNAPTNLPSNYPARLIVTAIAEYVCQILICYTAQGSSLIYMRQQYFSSGSRPYGSWYKITD